ncbi:MAG: toxin-antitoxin system HicB family antitoxin [Gammaproteobacteria bacterium]
MNKLAFDPAAYTIVIRRVREGDEFLFRGRVKELPDVETYGETYVETYDLAIDAIEQLHHLTKELGRSFPQPDRDPDDAFSGRVTLRMPKSLHRALATLADAEGVSLNQYIVSALSVAVGAKQTANVYLHEHYRSALCSLQVLTSKVDELDKFIWGAVWQPNQAEPESSVACATQAKTKIHTGSWNDG